MISKEKFCKYFTELYNFNYKITDVGNILGITSEVVDNFIGYYGDLLIDSIFPEGTDSIPDEFYEEFWDTVLHGEDIEQLYDLLVEHKIKTISFD